MGISISGPAGYAPAARKAGADVIVNGLPVGKTPTRVNTIASSQQQEAVFQRGGFDKATVKFDVKEGTVLAVEGFEGTDKCLARGGELAGKDGGAVGVKVAKLQHDMRFDIPCLGPRTVEVCADAGVRVLAFEPGRTLLLDPELLEATARRRKVSVVAAG